MTSSADPDPCAVMDDAKADSIRTRRTAISEAEWDRHPTAAESASVA